LQDLHPVGERRRGDIEGVAIAHDEFAGQEQPSGPGEIEKIDDPTRLSPGARGQHPGGDFRRLVAEDENAGRVCCGVDQTADRAHRPLGREITHRERHRRRAADGAEGG